MGMKRIIIGSAGWRMKYGNSHRILSPEEISKLIVYLDSKNINCIDTASAYGDVEKIIFSKIYPDFKIDTKLSTFSSFKEFQALLDKKIDLPIESLYFHDPEIFNNFSAQAVQSFIDAVNKKGFNAGFSIYGKKDIRQNIKFFMNKPNKLQAPAHILDLSILNEVIKLKLSPANINFRSFFARGLFFLEDERIKMALGAKYPKISLNFESLFGIPFTSINAQKISYSLINYITDLDFGCVIGLNTIEEIDSFTKNCRAAREQNLDWSKIITNSNKLIDIQEIKL